MDLIFVFTIFTIIFAWLLYRWQTRTNISLALKVPSNRLHTWLGWGHMLNKDSLITSTYDYGNKYGSNSVFWAGPIPIFLTSEPETIQDIFKSKNCVDKPRIIYDGFAQVVGYGITSLSEPHWSQYRKVFDKAFTGKVLTSYIPVFQNEIFDTIKHIDKHLELNESIDFFQIFKEKSLSVTMKTTLKRDCKETDYNLRDLVHNLHRLLDYMSTIVINSVFKIKIIRYLADITVYRKARQMIEQLKKIVQDSKEIVTKNNVNDPSYLPNLTTVLDFGVTGLKQNLLTSEELLHNLRSIFAASFETTSTGLFIIVCMLAMHPEYQERAYNEVISVLDDEDNDVTLTLEQVNQLIYLEMIINEAMRLFPLVPMIFRNVSNASVELSNGLVLPIGQIIGVDIYRLHRRKDIYGPEADRFNPENSSPENIAKRHPYAFIPFTKGQRFCIGWRFAYIMEKIFIAHLIRNYRFETDFKFDNLRIVNQVTIQLVETPVIKIQRRK